MIVAKKTIGDLKIMVHDWSFCTMWRNGEFHHRNNWSDSDWFLAQGAIDEANAKRNNIPDKGPQWLDL